MIAFDNLSLDVAAMLVKKLLRDVAVVGFFSLKAAPLNFSSNDSLSLGISSDSKPSEEGARTITGRAPAC